MLSVQPNVWYTAVLEVVGDEALFRMGEHIAYAKADQIRMPKNLVSLTLGTTWHEIRRVRIWRASPNPQWPQIKEKLLSTRKPFDPLMHDHNRPAPPSFQQLTKAVHLSLFSSVERPSVGSMNQDHPDHPVKKSATMMKNLLMLASIGLATTMPARADEQPNMLFCFSDDWGRYASIYRHTAKPGINDVIDTPALDAIGRSGVVFNNAFVSAPSCTPSRAVVVPHGQLLAMT